MRLPDNAKLAACGSGRLAAKRPREISAPRRAKKKSFFLDYFENSQKHRLFQASFGILWCSFRFLKVLLGVGGMRDYLQILHWAVLIWCIWYNFIFSDEICWIQPFLANCPIFLGSQHFSRQNHIFYEIFRSFHNEWQHRRTQTAFFSHNVHKTLQRTHIQTSMSLSYPFMVKVRGNLGPKQAKSEQNGP